MTTTALDAVRTQAADRPDSPLEEDGVWDDASRRTSADGEMLARQLLKRLGLTDEDATTLMANKPFRRAVTRWGIEYVAIQWYDTAITREQRWFRAWRWGALGIAVGTVVGTVIYAINHPAVGFAQFGILAAGGLAVMQIFVVSGDPKARLGTFRKARADLKESLYTFVETWAGRATERTPTGDLQPSADFMTALLQEIRTARKVARCEREQYFATFSGPAEIASAAGQALDVVRGRQGDYTNALSTVSAPALNREQAVSSRIQDLRDRLDEATAEKQALQDEMNRLKASTPPADAAKLANAQDKINEAETNRVKAQALLDLAVKSDVAHVV
jgi:hypothetical protein